MTNRTPTPSPITPPASSEAAPRWPLWARILVLPVFMLLATMSPLVLQFPLSLIPGVGPYLNSDEGLAWGVVMMTISMLLAPVVAITLVWLLVTKVDGRPLRDTGLVWTRHSLGMLALGIVVSAAVTLPLAALLQPYARPLEASSVPVWAVVIQGLVLGIVLQGFPEELIWRGYMLQTMRNRPVLAVVLSAVFFGALHIVSLGGQQGFAERLVYVVQAGAFGFAAGALLLLCRSLWVAVGIHAGLHFATTAATVLGVSTEGPVLWAAIAVGYIVVGLVALALRARGEGLQASVVIDR